jgi:hypothetical protein
MVLRLVLMVATRSHSRSASSSRWVVRKTVTPRSRNPAISHGAGATAVAHRGPAHARLGLNQATSVAAELPDDLIEQALTFVQVISPRNGAMMEAELVP